MKLLRKLSAVVLAFTVLLVMPKIPQARVMMTGSVTGFGMDVTPAANFTTDDWLNTAGMFTLTITNGDVKTVKFAQILIHITSGGFGMVLTGTLTVVDGLRPERAFLEELKPGMSYTVNNTMIGRESAQMSGSEFHADFKAVFDSIFGGAKLTKAASDKWMEELGYVVKREITEEDAQSTKDLLEEKGYERISTSAKADKYNYDFSKEVLGKEYEDINVGIWIEGEGSYQQKISIYIYK